MSQPWALVTGASSGIGEATAVTLAAAGYNLLLLARREDRLAALQAQLRGSHPHLEVRTFAVDVRDVAKLGTLRDLHADLLEKTELLINNAGLAKGTAKLAEGEVSDWDAMIDTNVKGLLYVTRLLLPHMLKHGRGQVVNVGSVAGRWVYPGGAVYCATKFAVRALSEGLRMDLLGTPLRVTNIEPGMVETEFSAVRLKDAEKAKAVYQGMKPLTAADIAETILWCVQRPAHVNIQELVIFPTDQAAIQSVNRRG